jgi:hypothetical protein
MKPNYKDYNNWLNLPRQLRNRDYEALDEGAVQIFNLIVIVSAILFIISWGNKIAGI